MSSSRPKSPSGDLRALSPGRRAAAAVAIAVALPVIAVAQRDLRRRPAEEIRGPKVLWRLASLNLVGALPYLLWARRRPTH